jgi:putative transposase
VFLDPRAGETWSKHCVTRLMREKRVHRSRAIARAGGRLGSRRVDFQPAAAPIRGEPTESRLGYGHHVPADVARVALLRRRHGFLLARRTVGWAAHPTNHRELVLDAVLMAVRAVTPGGTLIRFDQARSSGRTPGAAAVSFTALNPA